jgi:ubiquinone/menaquinone biosynthesis C-methylase UbiE
MKRDFDAVAKTWDQNDARARMSLAIADAMIGALGLAGTETVLDYGTGTGAIALRFQRHARQVIAADSSRGMLDVLEEKIRASGAQNVKAVSLDLEQESPARLEQQPDVVVSAMTLHHISDTGRFAETLHELLPVGGRIALADLDTEDGSFHSDNTGVEHFGFDRRALTQLFSSSGFSQVQIQTAYEMKRPQPDGTERTYPIFLLSAIRN